MKRFALFLAVLTVAAACASTDESAPASDTGSPAADGSTPVRDSMEDSGSSLTPDPVTPPDGRVAPDFTMALSDGATFTLSEQAMPVYMIFWADW